MQSEGAHVTTIDAYLAGLPEPVQDLLQQMRAIIREVAPEATETIKYRIPTFVLHENLVHFAAFQKHIGFYPTPSAMEAFKQELSPFATAKGSVQFPLDATIPWDLIRRIVEFRVQEVRDKMAKKSSKRKSSGPS